MNLPLATGSALDTIFAVATGAGRAAISIVRLSGSGTNSVVRGLAGRLPEPRHASLCRLRDARGVLLDRAVVLWLPGPASYTGEDSAELHLHGGRAVGAAVIEALLQAGVRPADAGEFTRRAFMSGRMDLLEAEAVDDLARAETQAQRTLALSALEGGARAIVQDWADGIAHALAQQEALIDFPEETGDEAAGSQVVAALAWIMEAISAHLAQANAGRHVRNGVTVAIAGAPNVGKSSLFNVLAGRDLAMVSPLAGTTRDSIEAQIELSGIGVTLIDTAGLREAADTLEAEGIRRAIAKADTADIVLWVTGRDQPSPDPAYERMVWVDSKADLAPARAGAVGVSAATMVGMADLVEHLTRRVEALARSDSMPVLSRARHVAALRDVLIALLRATKASLPELRAEDLRVALSAIGRLTGRVNTEALLDVIFSSFCIGK